MDDWQGEGSAQALGMLNSMMDGEIGVGETQEGESLRMLQELADEDVERHNKQVELQSLKASFSKLLERIAMLEDECDKWHTTSKLLMVSRRSTGQRAANIYKAFLNDAFTRSFFKRWERFRLQKRSKPVNVAPVPASISKPVTPPPAPAPAPVSVPTPAVCSPPKPVPSSPPPTRQKKRKFADWCGGPVTVPTKIFHGGPSPRMADWTGGSSVETRAWCGGPPAAATAVFSGGPVPEGFTTAVVQTAHTPGRTVTTTTEVLSTQLAATQTGRAYSFSASTQTPAAPMLHVREAVLVKYKSKGRAKYVQTDDKGTRHNWCQAGEVAVLREVECDALRVDRAPLTPEEPPAKAVTPYRRNIHSAPVCAREAPKLKYSSPDPSPRALYTPQPRSQMWWEDSEPHPPQPSKPALHMSSVLHDLRSRHDILKKKLEVMQGGSKKTS
eukprot:TRINITY_DN37075_c0_g1_i1.p1 TRINITY_DN37075_c0_g1~~TRINITY_DN37075_c0_g1_i1.p1  ORF type:complete len:442 (+),score=96.27 TRINITY_DN37075_c0_g1_i1:66-1391(+)